MSVHAQSPWYISVIAMREDRQTGWRISRGENDMRDGPAGDVCFVESSRADADLIAAAPVLLRSVLALLSCCYDEELSDEVISAVSEARKAVAMATGAAS